MPIAASVGHQGANRVADTLLVQALLNLHRRVAGLAPIATDGIVGPRTVAAIRDFQQRTRMRIADGRIDPGGPTLASLETSAPSMVEVQLRTDLLVILDHLGRELRRRGGNVPDALTSRLNIIRSYVLSLSHQGQAPRIGSSSHRGPEIVLAFAPAVAGVAIEALVIMFVALCAMLIMIQNAPAMGHALEDLLRRLQILMAQIVDGIRTTVEEIEKVLRRNPQAGMRCSEEVMRFRTLAGDIIQELTSPRDPDPVRQQQKAIRISNKIKQFQTAVAALWECLIASGAI